MSTASPPLTALLSHLAHEMRTPLSVAQGYTRMLTSGRYGTLTDDQTRAISATERCCQQLTALAEQLSLLGKIERGEVTLAGGVTVPLDPLLAALAAEHVSPPDHPVHLEHLPAAAPSGGDSAEAPAVQGDPAYLRRALAALVAVVVRTAPDSARILLTVRRADAPAGDDRTMAPAKEAAIVIAPADRVDTLVHASDTALDALPDFEPGLGLGLAIARRVVAAAGGRLGAERIDGVLAVRLILPVVS